ncbi:phosphotransferase enzyme family protein [Porphyromonas macacae]|uniref:phosphotransferase enzyme family protein n=1 Tax=Porphyromonas macacae TaxID=28115 RepID=UPI0035A13936
MMNLTEIFHRFLPDVNPSEIKSFGNGNINDTYLITDEPGNKRWLLQRINHKVFPRIAVLQKNVDIVSRKMAEKLQGDPDAARKYLYFYPVADVPERNYTEADGNYWRLCRFIDDSISLNEVTPQTARSAGEAFGRFEEILSDIPEGELGETIENFHNVSFRLWELQQAVEKDAAGRLASVRHLVDELQRRAEEMTVQERLYREGKLPKRTIHCDTKVDNILFSRKGGVLCVVDWDTVMPGFILSDVGDFIRTGVCSTAEDEPDTTKISVKKDVYKAFVEGYLSTARFLTPLEKSLIAYGGCMMTYMQAVRFLTDYINGDTYYKVTDSEHNLRRTLAQMTYLKRLDECREEMEELLKD